MNRSLESGTKPLLLSILACKQPVVNGSIGNSLTKPFYFYFSFFFFRFCCLFIYLFIYFLIDWFEICSGWRGVRQAGRFTTTYRGPAAVSANRFRILGFSGRAGSLWDLSRSPRPPLHRLSPALNTNTPITPFSPLATFIIYRQGLDHQSWNSRQCQSLIRLPAAIRAEHPDVDTINHLGARRWMLHFISFFYHYFINIFFYKVKKKKQ